MNYEVSELVRIVRPDIDCYGQVGEITKVFSSQESVFVEYEIQTNENSQIWVLSHTDLERYNG